MASSLSARGLTSQLFPRPSTAFLTTTSPRFTAAPALIAPSVSQCLNSRTSFSTSAPQSAKGAPGGKSRRKGEAPRDPKIVNMLKQFALLSPRRIPPPLRMARNRHLRHWTIHRAWLLFRRKERERREGELMRQYQGMYAACEELRLTDGPGSREQGYLYRVAMEKKGVYGHNGFPIEYTRPQTESPAREPWNHDWKR
ncbi:hypothetical protein QBC33DRAFT_523604 [Phialemonium atrogriseum]|uniref:Large ribosomal subunit protein mL40 n=1 Tax=Phialemonium atrogriseum TaxID=1093897 RepID=A0AAJ0FKA3_9PEZI|nr:uncharacterized protein QBC33DRAFT_523604 [Phialemonium atrogriseum]KAK1771401.1 hypothetical protein QBC33DRAFT_523604 [Phialemonium atrogriseum]